MKITVAYAKFLLLSLNLIPILLSKTSTSPAEAEEGMI